MNHAAEGLQSELTELGNGPPDDLCELRTFLLGHVGRCVEHLRSESLGKTVVYDSNNRISVNLTYSDLDFPFIPRIRTWL